MVTINDIAKKAGVSKSTVSKVINNYVGVSDETQKKVMKVIKDYNYWPNAVARSLTTNKTNSIGIFEHGHLDNFFFRYVIAGIEWALAQQGYDLIFFTNDKRIEHGITFSYTEKCENRNVDGALLFGFPQENTSQFTKLLNSDIPTVFFELDMIGKKTSYITSDNITGVKMGMRYLYKLGHRKIAMVLGPSINKPVQDRFFGYQQSCEELGLEYNPDWVFYGDYAQEEGYAIMKKLISMENRPTAFFGEDMYAVGAVQALSDLGLKVPEDFSVLGFDNLDLCRYYHLTTIDQSPYRMGEAGANLLLKIINGKNFSPVILPTELVIRNSCGNVN